MEYLLPWEFTALQPAFISCQLCASQRAAQGSRGVFFLGLAFPHLPVVPLPTGRAIQGLRVSSCSTCTPSASSWCASLDPAAGLPGPCWGWGSWALTPQGCRRVLPRILRVPPPLCSLWAPEVVCFQALRPSCPIQVS